MDSIRFVIAGERSIVGPCQKVGFAPRLACCISLYFLLGILVCGQGAAQSDLAAASSRTLTKAAEVRRLAIVTAGSGVPLHLKGVVTALSGWKDSFFLQDDSGGISVDKRDHTVVHQGDLVEVEGVTGSGLFAPVALSDRVVVSGSANPPPAREYSRSILLSGLMESQWIRIHGTVRSASVSAGWGRKVLFLQIWSEGSLIETRVHDFPEDVDFGQFADAEVDVQGVCGAKFNDKREIEQLRLFVPNLSYIQVRKGASGDSFDAPLTPIEDLVRFGYSSEAGNRIKVEGTLTWKNDGHTLYLQSGRYGIRVRTLQTTHLKPDGLAQVAGFVELGDQSLAIGHATVRAQNSGTVARPAGMHASDAIRTKDGLTLTPFDSQLVLVEGDIIDSFERGGTQNLLLRDGEVSFEARLAARERVTLPSGSRVRLTGVLEMERDGNGAPRAFHILMRSRRDLELLQTPWLTPPHLIAVIAGLAALLAAMIFRIIRLRRRLFVNETGEPESTDNRLRAGLVYASLILGCCGGGIGLIVLTGGWWRDIAGLRALLPGYVEMKANAAVGLLMLAGAILFDRVGKGAAVSRIVEKICCVVAITIGALTLVQYLTGLNLHIDELLFRDVRLTGVPGAIPGRMAGPTALSFVLLGTALLFLDARRFLPLRQLAALLVAILCMLSMMGYLYGAQALYRFSSQTAMAVHTSAALLLLSAGVLLARPERGVVRILISTAPGGVLARRLLLPAILIPATLSWLRWQGQLAGLYDTQFGIALSTSLNIVVFTIVIWLNSGVLDRMDTVRSRAEERLRESEGRLRKQADAMPQIVWTADAAGNPDYYNQRWTEYTGIDFNANESMGAWQPVIHPDDLPGVEAKWSGAVASGEPYEFEFRLRRAVDGAYRWHLARAVPDRHATGRIARWFGTTTDVEYYKQTEAAIQTLNESLETRVRIRTGELTNANEELGRVSAQLQGVLEAATQVAIVAVDLDRVIRIFNRGAEEMLLYKSSEIVGIHTTDLFMDPAEIVTQIERLENELRRPATRADLFINPALEGKPSEREMTHIRRDGSRLIVRLAVTAMKDIDGSVYGFLGVATDITVRKELENALLQNNEKLAGETLRAEKANEAKDVFLAAMSHEIRTPMNAILGMADILWESRLDAEQRQYVDVFRRAGSNLLTLVNEILDLSKIEAGNLELERIEFDLEEVADEAIELIAPRARAKNLLVETRIAANLPRYVMGDPVRVRQVLVNLLGNAVKFTAQGEISLSVTVGEAAPTVDPALKIVEFKVSDTGIGIPAEKIEAIFDDFIQADSSTTREYGGTGLGLGISRRLAERMHGTLTASSEPGGGSTFRFVATFEIPETSRREVLHALGDFHGKRALILDDNANNRMILRRMLAGWGLESDAFEHPGDALRLIRSRVADREPYALVLIDRNMPEMDGFECASMIHQVDAGLPVIMLSSEARPGDAARRAEVALAGYAVRPVKRSYLFQLVSDALGRTPATVAAERHDWGSASGLRILVAEDAFDNRLLIEAYMKDAPHALTFANDGKIAVEQFSTGVFDLILMDVNMPVMDGLSATKAIREIERIQRTVPIPIIALSANASEKDIVRSLGAGCTAHISKPVSKRRLLSAIREHSSSRLAETEHPALDESNLDSTEFLRGLIPEYLSERKKDVAAIPGLLQEGNFDRLRTLGHNMKGSGASYGFADITRLGAALEVAAEAREAEALRQNASQLSQLMEHLSLANQ